MKIANIFPIGNQSFYERENYVMILAHLIDKYDPKFFNYNYQYVILDNGLYENQMVSNSLDDLINIAEKSNIKINEIVIPDVFHDSEGTIKYFLNNLEVIKKWSHKYSFMFVAQGKNFKEFNHSMRFINKFSKGLNLVVGIPKLSMFDRCGKRAIRLYSKCKLPIHFLGLKESFSELLPVSKLIRGCDTSQVSYIVANNIDYYDGIDIFNFVRKGPNVDLASAVLDDNKLNDALVRARKGLKVYGIL